MVIAVSPSQNEVHVACGTDVPVGCTLVYNYASVDGCRYAVYDRNGACIEEHVYASTSDEGVRGGGFTIDANMSYIKFSSNTTLYKAFDVSVGDFIKNISSVDALQESLNTYNIDELYRQDIINIYLDTKAAKTDMLKVYPVGAVYLATTDTKPELLFGGAWQRLIGVFNESIFAWTRTGATGAVCGTFLCGDALCGQ